MSISVDDSETALRDALKAVAECRARIAHSDRQLRELGHLGPGAVRHAGAQYHADQAALPELEIEERRLRAERDNVLERRARERYATEVKPRREHGRSRLLFGVNVIAAIAEEEAAKDRTDYERGLAARGVPFVAAAESIARLRELVERIEGGAA